MFSLARASLLRSARPFHSTALRLSVPSNLSAGEATLYSKLVSSFPGSTIEVQDVSGGCGSFYAVSVLHESFRGLSTIKQHRKVNEVLKDEIKGMHGIQYKTGAPPAAADSK